VLNKRGIRAADLEFARDRQMRTPKSVIADLGRLGRERLAPSASRSEKRTAPFAALAGGAYASSCNGSGAGRDVPEPEAIDIDPARAHAVGIPSTMPAMATAAVPHVAVIGFPDDELITFEALFDLDVVVEVLFDLDILILVLILRFRVYRRRGYESEAKPKRGNDGKNHGKSLQHFVSSSSVMGRYFFW
jgi:hypothetical protein